ncbi:unnamed protein product [Nesidiocoris tenuis]|uniref:Uncharacterized protein n=1 Tax=Nesidiocoris tenuis TaxID=355587 RepID=A0A6H5HMS9_9HEMI|nr:unnamed protein product [Nesidiocoris tenuis]
MTPGWSCAPLLDAVEVSEDFRVEFVPDGRTKEDSCQRPDFQSRLDYVHSMDLRYASMFHCLLQERQNFHCIA